VGEEEGLAEGHLPLRLFAMTTLRCVVIDKVPFGATGCSAFAVDVWTCSRCPAWLFVRGS